jgi:Methyltransferase domain
MATVTERVESLALDLFDAIPSQTSAGDRRSLLAVQRATARRSERYAYLEIGSHLGGSIQPHLVDPRCERIYSIDPRPASQPDDRSPGYVARYEDNSTRRMLDLLRRISPEEVGKVRCFETDASAVDPVSIEPRPSIAFIDGEHTRRAVLSDFAFCRQVIAPGGTILLDDFPIVYAPVLEICRRLRLEGELFEAARLEGKVVGVFADPELLRSDPFLAHWSRRNRYALLRYRAKLWAKSLLPGAVGRAARAARRPLP